MSDQVTAGVLEVATEDGRAFEKNNDRVTEGVKRSTGPVNEAEIKKGCDALCKEYIDGQGKLGHSESGPASDSGF